MAVLNIEQFPSKEMSSSDANLKPVDEMAIKKLESVGNDVDQNEEAKVWLMERKICYVKYSCALELTKVNNPSSC